jgi:uncharacterized protein (DUF1786 family)
MDVRVLAMDIGSGTTDMLLTRPRHALENAVKIVAPSRTQVVAEQIRVATARRQAIVFHGPTMGGGAAGLAFVATPGAVLTFDDDPARVRALGVEVVEDDEAAAILQTGRSHADISSGDLDPKGLRHVLRHLGVDPVFDAVAVAVQDHGFSPGGSNRVFRFGLWEEAVTKGRRLRDLFHAADALPAPLTRMHATALQAAELADGCPVIMSDTAPAALYGALQDGDGSAVLVNVGNGHVVCAVSLNGRVHGVFEHHTAKLDKAELNDRLRRFLAGTLTNEHVRDDGGHGAVLSAQAAVVDLLGLPLIATGPRRDLLEGSNLPLRFAAPHGDMMLTGSFGLLRGTLEKLLL